MIKRIVCCLWVVLLTMLPMFSLAQESYTMAGFDGEESTHDWSTNQFFTRMQERTGLTFTFQEYTKMADWQKAKEAMFAQDGILPDVLFKAALTTDELIRYTESGQLIDLKPLLAEHAPNLWNLLQEHPDWLQAITLPNGMIGALPGIQEQAPQNAMWINQKWLEKLKLTMPTDWESLRNVLTAFATQDPNGNNKRDEVPMAFLGPWELKFFSHAFGVVANDYNIYLDDNGQVHFWPLEDSFIALARETKALYQAGLLDQNGFSTADTLRRLTDDKAVNIYGAFFAPTPLNLVTYTMSQDYVIIEPLCYEGQQVYRDLYGEITRGTFAITSACADPAALLRWVDLLYTTEGAIEAMVGIEGDAYLVAQDGLWDWKGGAESMNMATVSELSLYDTGNMPWRFPLAFYETYRDAGVRKLNADLTKLRTMTKMPFPHSYTLTAEERAEVAQIQHDLGYYVDESLARFVLGEWELDEQSISNFRNELIQRGADDMTAFWQKIALRTLQ